MPRRTLPILTPVDSNALLNWARWVLRARTERELARRLDVSAPQISKLRTGYRRIEAQLLVNLLDATDVKLRELPEKVRQMPKDWKERVKAGTKKRENKNPTAL